MALISFHKTWKHNYFCYSSISTGFHTFSQIIIIMTIKKQQVLAINSRRRSNQTKLKQVESLVMSYIIYQLCGKHLVDKQRHKSKGGSLYSLLQKKNTNKLDNQQRNHLIHVNIQNPHQQLFQLQKCSPKKHKNVVQKSPFLTSPIIGELYLRLVNKQ